MFIYMFGLVVWRMVSVERLWCGRLGQGKEGGLGVGVWLVGWGVLARVEPAA